MPSKLINQSINLNTCDITTEIDLKEIRVLKKEKAVEIQAEY